MGIIIRFYSDEHRPIHVHAQRSGRESVFEIFFEDGEVSDVEARPDASHPLTPKDLRLVQEFVEAHAEEIASAWTDYFVKGIKPTSKTISRWKP